MKKILVVASLLTNTVFGQDNVVLKGKISNPKGPRCYLLHYQKNPNSSDYEQVFLDSAELDQQGNFYMSCKIDKTVLAEFSDGNEFNNVILQPGDNLNLTLNTIYYDETIIYAGKGSEKNNAMATLYLIREELDKSMGSEELSSDTAVVFSYIDSISAKLELIAKEYQLAFPDVKECFDQYIGEGGKIKDQLRYFYNWRNQMDSFKGKPFLNFEGLNVKGQKVNLTDYKGRITVLDFWATWCGPCKMEMPFLKGQEEAFGKNINFVSVCVWSKQEEWVKAVEKLGLRNNIFIPEESFKQFEAYSINGVPRYIVLDEKLNILSLDASRPSENLWNKEYFGGK